MRLDKKRIVVSAMILTCMLILSRGVTAPQQLWALHVGCFLIGWNAVGDDEC